MRIRLRKEVEEKDKIISGIKIKEKSSQENLWKAQGKID